MSKFRKKPVVIEAMQFRTNNDDGTCIAEILIWVGSAARSNGTDIFIQTLEGEMNASVGDWIIRGVAGEFYPCKPEIFEQTYEPAG